MEKSLTTDTDMLKTKDVSRILNVPISTLKLWRDTGVNLDYFKFGERVFRYSKKSVEAFLAKSKVSANSAPATSKAYMVDPDCID